MAHVGKVSALVIRGASPFGSQVCESSLDLVQQVLQVLFFLVLDFPPQKLLNQLEDFIFLSLTLFGNEPPQNHLTKSFFPVLVYRFGNQNEAFLKRPQSWCITHTNCTII